MEPTIKKIFEELDDIKSIISGNHTNNQLPQIEKDIVLSKLQTIYLSISKMGQEIPVKEEVKQTKQNIGRSPKKPDITNTPKPEAEKSVLNKKQDVIAEEKENNVEDFLQIETIPPIEKPIETIVGEELSVKPKHDQKIIAEKFQKSEPLINELMAKQVLRKDISSTLQSKPLKDIATAVGVNERFIFIKELFNGDAETYDKTIKILNNVHNFNEAFNYISQTFSWDFESDTAHKLLELVRRRHIVDNE